MEMDTKNFSFRLSGENRADVKAYAAEHGVTESTAVGRLLEERRALAEGRDPVRFAIADPDGVAFAVANGSLSENGAVLKRTIEAIVSRNRKWTEEEAVEIKAAIASLKTALAENLARQRRLMGLEKLPRSNIHPLQLEKEQAQIDPVKVPQTAALVAMVTGKRHPASPQVTTPAVSAQEGQAKIQEVK
jgi:hypothetical protein